MARGAAMGEHRSGTAAPTTEVPMPAPYRSIACCISADPAADDVIAEAVALRRGSPGDLHLVTVVGPAHTSLAGPFSYYSDPPGVLADRAAEWLAERVERTPGALPVVLDGFPPRTVCRWAAANGIDLIVAAAHRGFVERTLLGGFAAYVAYHAPCPVLLVRPPVAEEGSEGG
jgi:nucleotide-binding universal stress UspA family protein